MRREFTNRVDVGINIIYLVTDIEPYVKIRCSHFMFKGSLVHVGLLRHD